MTPVPEVFPFTRLKLQVGEEPLWFGHNPTFHRFRQYGLLISNQALHLGTSAWLFSKWRRFPLDEISDITLADTAVRPEFSFRFRGKAVRFRAPSDAHLDDVQFDRRVLADAVEFMKARVR